MSLLMKALEKAAKDRAETDTGHTAPAESGLTLEPMAKPASAMPAPGREPSPSPRRPASAAPSAQAATFMRASQHDTGGGIGAYVREHPLMVFGTLATLFLAGYGAYVYVQITNPGMFVRQQPARPTQAVPAPLTPPAAGVIEACDCCV